MIAALFALAAAMIVGGCAAVVQGFPYVRLESGLAMVIAGSVAASSGAVLIGLGVVAAGLRRVERAAGRAVRDPASEPARTPADVPAPTPGEGRPRLPPVLPAAPAFVIPPEAEPAFAALPTERDLRAERDLLPGRDLRAERDGPALAAEPELPIPGLAPAPEPGLGPADPAAEPSPPEPVPSTPEDDLFGAPEARDDEPALRPSLDATPEPEPARPASPAIKPERTVVGRYSSGGNTYVMFEDGSIEAETPQGRFTFGSLDELKAFVDGGGESGTRGAA